MQVNVMFLPCYSSCTATTQSICISSRADKRAVGVRSIANNNKHYYDYFVQAQAQALYADFESLKLLQLQPVFFLLPACLLPHSWKWTKSDGHLVYKVS